MITRQRAEIVLALNVAERILVPQGSVELVVVIVADTLAAALLAMAYATLLLLW
jgi:hypothetical protein